MGLFCHKHTNRRRKNMSWSREKTVYGTLIRNEGGKNIGIAGNVPILEEDGYAFKDLAGTGKLLPYEDWRLDAEPRAADLAARLFINNGQRYLGFTPTEQYSAKACFGISGLVQVPELKDGQPNDFLTKLFAKVRQNLEEESKSLNKDQEEYKEVMEAVKRICEGITSIESVPGAFDAFNGMEHVLTSKKEGMAMIKKRLAEIGVKWDKANNKWVAADAQ